MKFIKKTYLLLAIIIVTASINLFLLYSIQGEGITESNSLRQAGELKVKISNISGLANSIASGNELDRRNLSIESTNVESIFSTIKTGGIIDDQQISSIPGNSKQHYDNAYNIWNQYQQNTETIRAEPVFDPQMRSAINYVLEKNGDMILLTNDIINEFESLDRNYRDHKEIANQLHNLITEINSDVLLISLGEDEENTRESLKKNRLLFEVGIRKLLQIPINDLNLENLDVKSDTLESIPVENSMSLKELDPLWESVQLRLLTIENNSILSSEFGAALKSLREDQEALNSALDNLITSWNKDIQQKTMQRQNISLAITGIDIFVFILVFVLIRKSLIPLSFVTNALTKIKEGVYGEKIKFKSKDEFGELVDTFNVMSQTIKTKTEEAKQIDQTKDEFMSMITHELKTPLVPIQGYSDMLLKGHLGDLTPKQKERIEIIKQSSSSLLRLISDLLDAQKLELNQLKINKKNESIETTIIKSIENMMPIAKKENIEIKYNGTSDVNILHDRERIIQVLSNLIKNSIQSIKPNPGKITITMIESDNEIKFAVNDDGSGIPKESFPNLFKKFYQADSSFTREREGSGLGLSICRGIINLHGGKIWADENQTVGATIHFTIPKNAPQDSKM